MKKSKLTVMSGLPGSGKSTWLKDHKKSDEVIVCLDDIRKEIFGHQYHQPAEQFVIAIGEAMVRLLLMQGCQVILDSTAPTWAIRKKWFEMAKNCNADTRLIYVDADPDKCIERDSRRVENKRVGKEVMDRFISVFQEPTWDEVKSEKDFVCVVVDEDED